MRGLGSIGNGVRWKLSALAALVVLVLLAGGGALVGLVVGGAAGSVIGAVTGGLAGVPAGYVPVFQDRARERRRVLKRASGGTDISGDDKAAAGGDEGTEPETPDEVEDTVPVRLESLPKEVHGRENLLQQLMEYRRTGGLVVLVGGGGIGKSTLARELVRRTAAPEPPPAWEVSAATSRSLLDDLRVVAANLGGNPAELAAIGVGDRAGPDCLWRLLGRAHAGWVLIVDNADELEFLGKPGRPGGQPPDPVTDGTGWVRAGPAGLVLVTSRQRSKHRWPGSAVLIEVGVLDEAAAARVLRDLAPNAGSERQARALARRLGCLPLALHLAGSYLGSGYAEHPSFHAYRTALETDPRVIRFLELHAGDAEAIERMLVMRTWELSLDALARHGLPQARPLLRLLSCFAPAVPIPLALVQGGQLDSFLAACSQAELKVPRLDQVLQGLDHLGLIASTARRKLVVHPVVADTNRTYLMEAPAGELPENMVRTTAVTLLAAQLDGLDVERPSTWDTFRVLTPHLQALAANSAPRLDGVALDTLTGTTGQVAIGYGHMDRPAVGIALLASVLVARRDQAGAVFLLARQRLAVLLDEAGQHRAAEQIWREVLTAQMRDWPQDHPAVFAARHCVTVSQSYRRSWEQVGPEFDALLAEEVRALGADHLITLATRQEYALRAGSHDGWDVAAESLRGIVEDATRTLGKNNVFTLGARHNLAQVLRRLQRGDEATVDARRLIDDEREALGDDHLLTAETARLAEGGFFKMCPLSVPQLHEDFARYLLRKGCAMADEPEPESALSVFDDLVARFGGDNTPEIRAIVADGIHSKALLLKKLDRVLEAIAAYEGLIARYDGDEPISQRELVAIAFHNKAVWAILSLGDPDQALEAAQQALNRYQRLADNKPETFAEKVSDARAFLDQIKATAPQTMLKQANTLAQTGRRQEALEILNRFIDRYGDDSSEQVRPLVATAMLRKGILLSTPQPTTD